MALQGWVQVGYSIIATKCNYSIYKFKKQFIQYRYRIGLET